MLLSLQLALAALRFTDTTDRELVDLYLLTHSERYFAELYRRFGAKVYARCRTLLGDEHEAHDAVQEIFERVLHKLAAFRGDSSFSTWVYTISSNHCLDRLRKRRRRRERPTEAEVLEPLVEQQETVAELDWLELQGAEAIKYILAHLPAADSALLELKYMDDLSVQEIGEALDLQPSATKMRLSRARTRAREVLADFQAIQTLVR